MVNMILRLESMVLLKILVNRYFTNTMELMEPDLINMFIQIWKLISS